MKPSRLLSPQETVAVERAARDWVARREAGFRGDEGIKLQAWLGADPAHRAAFAQADASRGELDWPLHAGLVDDVLAGLEQRSARRGKRRTLAVTALVAVLGLATTAWWRSDPDHGQWAQAQGRLTVMQPRRLALPDGSVAELRDGAELTFDFSGGQRHVFLGHGEAHFQVQHDPAHPFIVTSSGVAVRAVGTAFSVRRGEKDVGVLVTEGRVAIEPPLAPVEKNPALDSPAPSSSPAAPMTVAAGTGVSVNVASRESPANAVRTVTADEFTEQLAWRVPRLKFSGTPLAEVVAAMNQHNSVQFVLADPELKRLQLSGVLRADKPDALVEMLASPDFGLLVERSGETLVVRRAL